MWILLHERKTPLWKYPVLTVNRCLSVPAVVEVRAVQEPPVVQVFPPEWSQGRLPLHGGTGICNAVAGTPADNTHASRTALAFPDLDSPFPKTEICSHHRCF